MKTQIFSAALLALAFSPVVSATANAGASDVAIEACSNFNEYGPVEVMAAVDDGMGDTLVWLTDADEDLWACNASGEGDIFANVMVDDDLLEGEGPAMVQLVSGNPSRHPELQAGRLCLAVAEEQNVEIVASVEDGLGDYMVWLEVDGGESYIMCNASSDGALYAFETVAMPLNDGPVIEPVSNDTCNGAPVTPAVTATRPDQFG